jgi:soluble lytic murein transglycosylase-like protein
VKPWKIIPLIMGLWMICQGAVETVCAENDPWQLLRAKFLPFSRQEEEMARHQAVHAGTFQDRFAVRLKPYQSLIAAASRQFDIPWALLQAVIMAESGGNPRARAGITSAKGLMQTIDPTFKMARTGLAQKGIAIADDPFDPEASIMAGAWYLDRMYQQALSDGKMARTDRDDIGSWRYPLEYYYAGPGNGVRAENKIQVYSNGETRVIDKRAYSGKIQSWAQILAAS